MENKDIPGITFTGDIHIAGDMFNIHDNQTVNITMNGQPAKEKTESTAASAVLVLLDKLVLDAIKDGKSPKYILLPVRAAKDADVLPLADLKWMNERYNLNLSPMNWSTWVNKEDAGYDSRELLPLVNRFRALRNP
jgi:hypothetical protein